MESQLLLGWEVEPFRPNVLIALKEQHVGCKEEKEFGLGLKTGGGVGKESFKGLDSSISGSRALVGSWMGMAWEERAD